MTAVIGHNMKAPLVAVTTEIAGEGKYTLCTLSLRQMLKPREWNMWWQSIPKWKVLWIRLTFLR